MSKKFIDCALNQDTMHILGANQIASIHVTANLWRDKTYGNTYNSAEVSVLIQGENKYRDLAVFSLVYGYGNYYMQRVKELFEKLNIDLKQIAKTEAVNTGLKRNAFNAAAAIDGRGWVNAETFFKLEQL